MTKETFWFLQNLVNMKMMMKKMIMMLKIMIYLGGVE